MNRKAMHVCGIKERAGEACIDVEACGRTPEEGYSVLALALAGFRRLYGIAARPEDMPREWANVVREVRQDLQDSLEAREDLAMP